jgi:hypothetical protein
VWSGNKLIVPRSFGGFENWLVWLYEGIMLFTGPTVGRQALRTTGRQRPWISGTKPTSGNLNTPRHGLRRLTWGSGATSSQGGWLDPSFT